MKTNPCVTNLKKKIAKVDCPDFHLPVTEDMHGERFVAAPPLFPTAGEHPRLLLDRKTLPLIRRALRRAECREGYEQFLALADDPFDGVLPEAFLHEKGRLGDHNMDCRGLGVIQAKALQYLLTGDETYGYSAVLGMKNYLCTLNIRWIHSDQCREFGFVMYITACVYDWCYDLLTEDDKTAFTSAVEHKLCTGTTEDTVRSTFGGVKMEVGFPPRGGGAVSGHGSEMMILRDYLAYAVAVYDEHPGWYEYIAGRVYQDYVPVRNTYYGGGLYGQGTPCYASWRFCADTWCSWIMKYAVGQIPFDDGQAQVARNMFSQETEDAGAFLTGDIYTLKIGGNYASFALQCAFLYGDASLRAQAKHYFADFKKFGFGVADVNATEFLILSSDGKNAAKDRFGGFPAVAETSYPFGTMTARNHFDGRPAISYMKVGERSMANHDHADHGTFQLYYKGLLAGDGGLYSGYGSDQHYYFHRATVAHSGLLIYNPALADKTARRDENGRVQNRDGFFYSGGQRYVSETGFLGTWSGDEYDFAKVTGRAHGTYPSGGAKYAYLAGDITKAYPKDTVDSVSRQMLTLFTEDEKQPMLFFTYDRVTAKDKDFGKTYLLQAPFEPAITGNVVRIDNGNANLTLHVLTEDTEISAIGGHGKMFYIPEADTTILPPNGADGREWGRVLVKPKTAKKTDEFLCAYVVADDGNENTHTPVSVNGDSCTGAAVRGNLVIFAEKGDGFAFPNGFDTADAYLCGLGKGLFAVSVDGAPVGRFSVTEEENFLHLRVTRGKVSVTKIG